MFGLVGYRPGEHYASIPLASTNWPIPESRFLATAYVVYQEFAYGTTTRRRLLAHSLAAISILSGAGPERNRAAVENGCTPVEIAEIPPPSRLTA